MRIVLRRPGTSNWTVIESALYRAEDELQQLLADSPSLLPLGDMRTGATEVLVAIREFQIPGSGYLDLLGFSGQGDVVLMECKHLPCRRSHPRWRSRATTCRVTARSGWTSWAGGRSYDEPIEQSEWPQPMSENTSAELWAVPHELEGEDLAALSDSEIADDEEYVDDFAYYNEDKDEWVEPGDEDEDEEPLDYDVNIDDREDWS